MKKEQINIKKNEINKMIKFKNYNSKLRMLIMIINKCWQIRKTNVKIQKNKIRI